MGSVLYLVLWVLWLIFLARVILSWIPTIDRSNPTVDKLVQFIYDFTEPVLRPIRQALPATGPIDFSTLIVLVAISLLMRLV